MRQLGVAMAVVMSLWPWVLRAADHSGQEHAKTPMAETGGVRHHAASGKTTSPPSPKRRMAFTSKSVAGAPDQPARSMASARSGARGSSQVPQLYVLLPRQVAITTLAQPSLFWYLSEPVQQQVKVNINTSTGIDPILTLSLDGSRIRGIQRLDLSRLAVKLKPGVRYEWVITVVVNPKVPSENIYAKSVVWRVQTPPSLVSKIAGADRRERAAIAAEEGIWVDALAGISDLIEHHPEDRSLRQDRADLLRQAEFEVAIEPIADRTFEEKIAFQPVVKRVPKQP